MPEIDIFKFPDELDKLITTLTGALDREDLPDASKTLSKIITTADGQNAIIKALDRLGKGE